MVAYFGISINDFDIDLAFLSSDEPLERIQVVRFQDTTRPVITLSSEPSTCLPVTLLSPRQLGSGDWLEHTLRRIHAGCPELQKSEAYDTCIAISSSASRPARDRCREIARNNGWRNVRVCGHNVAIAVDRFRESSSPVTALICQIEFDHVDISLVSALKGVVRVRDHWRTPVLSHRIVDEAILVALQQTLELSNDPHVNWQARWLDAYRIRKQLDKSTVTALELSSPEWGVTGTLDASHEDLWSTLDYGVESLLETIKRLLSHNRVGNQELDQILLLGGSPISWNLVRTRLNNEFGAGTQVVPIHHSSVGAVLVARSTDSSLTDTPPPSSTPPTDSSPVLRSEIANPSLEIRFHFEPDSGAGHAAEPAGNADFARSLHAVWSYIRGVSSVSPERSREIIQQVISEAGEMLAEVDAVDRAFVALANPHLDNARRALANGRRAEAVSESHRARELEPNNPAVFREMINLHIEAARASESLEQAVEWLECAHSHDQSDTVVYQLLAKYAYQWAQQLEEMGRVRESLKMIDRSLVFDPFNQDASRFADQLRQRGSGLSSDN